MPTFESAYYGNDFQNAESLSSRGATRSYQGLQKGGHIIKIYYLCVLVSPYSSPFPTLFHSVVDPDPHYLAGSALIVTEKTDPERIRVA